MVVDAVMFIVTIYILFYFNSYVMPLISSVIKFQVVQEAI